MSLDARDIAKRAYRKLGSLASGDDPTAEEMADLFQALQGMLRSLAGTVIGPRLSPQAMTGSMQAENGGMYQAVLGAAANLTAPLNPKGGSRFGVADAAAAFGANPLTILRNGRLFQGAAANLPLAVNGFTGVWFFDPDTANWVLEQDLADLTTVPPYPDRLIDFLPDMLAVFFAGEVGADVLTQDVISLASSGLQAFARNYGRRGRNQIDPPAGFSLAKA